MGNSLGPGSALGKRQKTGSQQKIKRKERKGERSESRGGQLASLTVFFFAFSPHFYLVKSTGHEVESN